MDARPLRLLPRVRRSETRPLWLRAVPAGMFTAASPPARAVKRTFPEEEGGIANFALAPMTPVIHPTPTEGSQSSKAEGKRVAITSVPAEPETREASAPSTVDFRSGSSRQRILYLACRPTPYDH